MEQLLPTPPDGWVMLNDLANDLGWSTRAIRDYVNDNVALDDRCRVRRLGRGGHAQWISPTAAEVIRNRYPRRSMDAPGVMPASHGSRLEDTGGTLEGSWEPPGVAGEGPRGPEGPLAASPGTFQEHPSILLERLLEETSKRADASDARVDELQHDKVALKAEVEQLRKRVGELEKRSETAETLLRRAREEVDRWRARAEEVLIAWHQWRRALDLTSRWRLWRKQFVPEPVAFTSGPALAKPSDEVG